MRAPRHWYAPPGLASALLSPLGGVYARATARRLAQGPRAKLGVPVICVGNLTAGGTGKTPVVMALAERLADRQPHILSRGYGGTLAGPVRVDPGRHSAAETGDEPLLLSAFAPVWVSKDRHAGGRAAVDAGAGLLILDDGFQNGQLAYDLQIVVVDAGRGFGNGQVIPAGPLREPISTGLARADLVISIGPDGAQAQFSARHSLPVPILTARLEPLPTGLPLRGAKVLAFAGIGDPEKFFATLRGIGADLHRTIALGDHQALSPALMSRIERDAKALNALIATTEKDAVRLPASFRQKVVTVPVRLKLDDPDLLDAALARLS
ncbi:MAG: tetraacyldisaccharide 4'-kinase [Pseudomonadota bacterium]